VPCAGVLIYSIANDASHEETGNERDRLEHGATRCIANATILSMTLKRSESTLAARRAFRALDPEQPTRHPWMNFSFCTRSIYQCYHLQCDRSGHPFGSANSEGFCPFEKISGRDGVEGVVRHGKIHRRASPSWATSPGVGYVSSVIPFKMKPEKSREFLGMSVDFGASSAVGEHDELAARIPRSQLSIRMGRS